MRPWRCALLALLLLPLPAAALDPRFVWETVETPHFQVHYHQGMYRYAQKMARAAELSHERLLPLLDHSPSERTQIVAQDDTDFANGNATPLLYDLIHAYAAPPDSRSTLADFDDNAYELIAHEYTHILHLDTVLGLPEAVNDIFGKLWIPNGVQPLWFIEGIATFAESEVSSAGRVRASEEDMLVRAEALAGELPRIDQLSNARLDWPRGFGQYTIGSRFLDFIRDQYGLGALRDLSHDFGSRAIPFGLNFSADRVLGSTYLQLYDEYSASELGRAQEVQAAVREGGETSIEPLTRLGEWVRTPRWSPDGSTLYYTNAGPDRLAEIRAVRPGPCCGQPTPMADPVRPGDRHVANLWSDGGGDDTLSVAPDGRIIYARVQAYQEFETVLDLYSVDPATGASTRVSRGLRARSPDVARDGTIAFVWRTSRAVRGPFRGAGGQPALFSRRHPRRLPPPPRRGLGRADRGSDLARRERRHARPRARPRSRLDRRRPVAALQQRPDRDLQRLRLAPGRAAPGDQRGAGRVRAGALAGRNAARRRDLQRAGIRRGPAPARACIVAAGHGPSGGTAASAAHRAAAAGGLSDPSVLTLGDPAAAFLAALCRRGRVWHDRRRPDRGVRRRGSP